MILLAALLTSVALYASLALGAGKESSQGSEARRTPPRAVRVCPRVLHAVKKWRESTWDWQDTLQEPRNTSGYVAGVRTRSCRVARQALVNWHVRTKRAYTLVRHFNSDIRSAILFYFGSDVGPGAIVVANCETGGLLDNIPAALAVSNGHYFGIFQLGDPGLWEIHRYATWRGVERYTTVIDQVAAAARMQRSRSWSAWACRPDGSVAY
jgi:hypothetical protein